MPDSHDEAAGQARAAEAHAAAENRLLDRLWERASPLILDRMEGRAPVPENGQKGVATPPWWVLAIGGVLITGVLNPLVTNLTAAGGYGDKITSLAATVATLAAKVDQLVDRSGQSVSKLEGTVQGMQFHIDALQKAEDESRTTRDGLTRALNESEKADAEEKARIEALEQRTQNMIEAMRQLRQDVLTPNRPRQYPDAEPQRDKDSQAGSWPSTPKQQSPFAEASR